MASSHDRVSSKYPMARLVLGLLSIVGWILFILGCVMLVFAVIGFSKSSEEPGIGMGALILFGPAVGSLVIGLLVLANAQLTRAAIDSADYSREMLMLTRRSMEQD